MINHDSMPNLMHINHTHEAMIELTTSCNLRCEYCNVSMPDWKAQNLSTAKYNEIILSLLRRKVKIVHLHGHGETTIIPNWHLLADQLNGLGIMVSLCSNLMKAYSTDEYLTLSRLSNLTISIDTIDPELFKQLRRGGNLDTLFDNLRRIRQLSHDHKHKLNVSWSIVVCNLTINGLLDLVDKAIDLQINGLTFCNLGYFDNPKRTVQIKHISDMPPESYSRMLSVFETIRDMCKRHHIVCDIQPGLIDSMPNDRCTPTKSIIGLL